jgi:hypothetical protein
MTHYVHPKRFLPSSIHTLAFIPFLFLSLQVKEYKKYLTLRSKGEKI